jgi:TonB family protein
MAHAEVADVDRPSTPTAGSAHGLHIWAPYADSEVRFKFEQGDKRIGGALGASLVGHIAAVVLLTAVGTMVAQQSSTPFLPDLTNSTIVWLPEEGPGGGGGGGGNKSPDPPKLAELPGKEAVTVPVTKPPALEQKKPEEEPVPEADLTIPAKTLASAEIASPGVLVGMESAPGPTSSQGSGEGGGAGTGRGTGIGPGEGSGLGPGRGGGTGGGEYRPGNGVTLPRVIREVKPQYTADAMRAKIQGTVLLEAVVMPDGSVGRVEVVRSLDSVFGLDQEALKAARQWRFVPGSRLGAPVPVVVTIELTFTLR